MTNQDNFPQLKDSPLLRSLRSGTTEQLITFRNQFEQNATERRTFTICSFLRYLLYGALTAAVGVLILGNKSMEIIPWLLLGGEILCISLWHIRYGRQAKTAKAIEVVIFSVVDSLLEEKLQNKSENTNTQLT